MKRTLLTKIFLGFLLFGLFGFLIVATFTSKLSFDKLKHDEVTNLIEAASSVADVLNSHTEERLIPVSYTHLDVYKRQFLSFLTLPLLFFL